MDANKAWSLAGGIGLGAGLMYLLDPLGGRRRRAWARDKVITISRKSDAAIRKTSRDVQHRAQGVITELRTGLREEETPDNTVRPSRRGPRFDLFQEKWSPTTRFLVGAAGGGLAVYGGIRRDAAGYAMTAAGIGLLARSVANRDFRRKATTTSDESGTVGTGFPACP